MSWILRYIRNWVALEALITHCRILHLSNYYSFIYFYSFYFLFRVVAFVFSGKRYLSLPWLITHTIDEKSPLYSLPPSTWSYPENHFELIVVLVLFLFRFFAFFDFPFRFLFSLLFFSLPPITQCFIGWSRRISVYECASSLELHSKRNRIPLLFICLIHSNINLNYERYKTLDFVKSPLQTKKQAIMTLIIQNSMIMYLLISKLCTTTTTVINSYNPINNNK